MAWLHSKEKDQNKSRADQYEIELPSAEPCEFLVEYLFEVGPITGDGVAVSYQELEAWLRLSCHTLTTYEAYAIRRMSVVYTSKYREFSNSLSKCPTKVIGLNPEHVEHIKEMLRR